MKGKGCKGPVKGAKHWSSKGVAHYRDGGEVGGIAGGAGAGGSSIGGGGGNGSVSGGGGNKGVGPNVRGTGVTSGTTSGNTMRNPSPVAKGVNVRPTGAPPPKTTRPATPKPAVPKPAVPKPRPKPPTSPTPQNIYYKNPNSGTNWPGQSTLGGGPNSGATRTGPNSSEMHKNNVGMRKGGMVPGKKCR